MSAQQALDPRFQFMVIAASRLDIGGPFSIGNLDSSEKNGIDFEPKCD